MNRRVLIAVGLANAGIVLASASMIGLAPTASADSGDPYPPASSGATQAVASVDVTTTTPGAGQAIDVSGTGFLPGERVSVDFHSVVIHLATVPADSSGAGRASITVPQVSGDHEITLTGLTSGHLDSVAVTVHPASTAARSLAVSDSGSLAYTGAAVLGMGVLGAGLLAGGTAFVVSGRRRDAQA